MSTAAPVEDELTQIASELRALEDELTHQRDRGLRDAALRDAEQP